MSSYFIAYHVAKERLPHTLTEKVLSSYSDIVHTMLNEKSAEKLIVPVSDNKISHRICSIAEHLEEMPVARLQYGRVYNTAGQKH